MARDKITTKSLGRNFVDIPQEFVSEETTRTKTDFKAEMHSGGVRGYIIRYRKGVDGHCQLICLNPDLAVTSVVGQIYHSD